MSDRDLEDFARDLIKGVRDIAIANCDALSLAHAKSPAALRMKKIASQSVIEAIVPDIVDQTLFALLDAIDQGLIPLSYRSPNGSLVDLTAEGKGELGGWYMGSGGWRAEYSSARFNDDCA